MSTCSETAIDFCRNELESSLACFTGNIAPSPVMIPAAVDQQRGEAEVARFFNGLAILDPTMECQEGIGRFLCINTFSLCIGDKFYSIDSETCMDLRDTVCTREWMTASQFISLPVCEKLPMREQECKGMYYVEF